MSRRRSGSRSLMAARTPAWAHTNHLLRLAWPGLSTSATSLVPFRALPCASANQLSERELHTQSDVLLIPFEREIASLRQRGPWLLADANVRADVHSIKSCKDMFGTWELRRLAAPGRASASSATTPRSGRNGRNIRAAGSNVIVTASATGVRIRTIKAAEAYGVLMTDRAQQSSGQTHSRCTTIIDWRLHIHVRPRGFAWLKQQVEPNLRALGRRWLRRVPEKPATRSRPRERVQSMRVDPLPLSRRSRRR